MENPNISFKPLSVDNWQDFESLMHSDRQCQECWCLNHHLPPGCATGPAAQKAKYELVRNHCARGLLAFEGNLCIGWIAVDPLIELSGHDCSSDSTEGEWAAHCLFIRDGYRGLGLSKLLIQAAIDFAKQNQAKALVSFPIPQQSIGKYPVHEAEFSGRLSTYKKLGFSEGRILSPLYQRVEFRLEKAFT